MASDSSGPIDVVTHPQPHLGALEYSTVGTLGKNSWQARAQDHVEPPSPPCLNILLGFISCCFCPLLGVLAVIYSIEAKLMHRAGKYAEAEAYSYRARGTAFYSIAIGVGLVGMAVLFGLGNRFNLF